MELSTAILELRLVGDIAGTFFVPRYQRGYRWGEHQVKVLLEDLWTNGDKPYCLQPIVVKDLGDDRWELVDGQQRLTTLFLTMAYMERESLQADGPGFELEYETRPGSKDYLRTLDADLRTQNIDYHHLYQAYACIDTWFKAHKARRQFVANKLYGFLFERVQVIWYVAPPDLESTLLFTRLNVGKIPLTDAELVKAALLSGSGKDRAHELAAQWDAIERDLRRPEVWAFITDTSPESAPTRITLLLDTMAGGELGRGRPSYYTFLVLQQRILAGKLLDVWSELVNLHGLAMGWYEHRSLFHKVGYLVAVGHTFQGLVLTTHGLTRSKVQATLDELIRDSLKLTEEGLFGLTYENASDKRKCDRLLLLMNVETVRQLQNSTERYAFAAHHAKEWSLEHIHAQQAEALNKVEQWRAWLSLHKKALLTVPVQDEAHRERLLLDVDRALPEVDRQSFENLAPRLTAMLSPPKGERADADLEVHGITNLALLSSSDNSALSNAVFEVKRQRILQQDKLGAYLPICTRRVFLKYYTNAGAEQIHFWGPQDRRGYADAILDVLRPYLSVEQVTP